MPPNVKFQCAYCERSFQANFTLRRHVKKSHPDSILPSVVMGRKPKESSAVMCPVCHTRLSTRKVLASHRRTSSACQLIKPPPGVNVHLRRSAERRIMQFDSEQGIPVHIL